MEEMKNLQQEQEQTTSERPPFSGRTSKLLGLFAATALAVSVGCSDAPASTGQTQQQAVGPDGQTVDDDSNYCLDDNDDGYCDEDGSRINHSTFIWIGGINTGTKKYYKTSAPDARYVYKPSKTTGGTGVSSGSTTTNKPSSNTSQPPKSSSGTGQVINKSAPPASSSSGSSSSSTTKPSSGTVSSGSTAKSSSGGVSSSSGKGGIGSSSSSSSS